MIATHFVPIFHCVLIHCYQFLNHKLFRMCNARILCLCIAWLLIQIISGSYLYVKGPVSYLACKWNLGPI